jgi:putative hydrolase of the HAD superfamily
MIRATLWDFGGVILSSPFAAFSRYEEQYGLPGGFIRRLNAANPHTNAWAHLERGDISFDEFCDRFEREAREVGGELDARHVMALLSGEVRPAMVEALRRCHERLKTALLTNNFLTAAGDTDRSVAGSGADHIGAGSGADHIGAGSGADHIGAGSGADHSAVLSLFDVVIESSKAGVRKPDPRFYAMACDALSIRPDEAVFLDDLGINLKPARQMGMTTIKVTDPDRALAELEDVVGFPLG